MSKTGPLAEPPPSSGTNDWIVPRRVMCAFFWVGIILLFTGIILLVTSKHKEEFYQSWGAILLGLGFCLLLICFILCMHAYCVITVADEDAHQSPSQRPNPQPRPQDTVRKKAPLKHPPNFKLPSSSRPHSVLDKKRNFNPGRLKPINENGSPKLGLSRSDSYSSNYGSTSSRADHVRTCMSKLTSYPSPASTSVAVTDDEIVHYVASPPTVKISVGKKKSTNQDLNLPSPNKDFGSKPNGLHNSSLEETDFAKEAPFTSIDYSSASEISGASTPRSRQDRSIPSHIVVRNTPVFKDYHFDVSLLQPNNPTDEADRQLTPNYRDNPGYDHKEFLPGLSSEDQEEEHFMDDPYEREDYPSDYTTHTPCAAADTTEGQQTLPRDARVGDENVMMSEFKLPMKTNPKSVHETHIYSRPIVTARVTQLPGSRSDSQRFFPNGAPPQLATGYNRQYPITAVHAYPIRPRNSHPYSPLRVYVDNSNGERTTQAAASGRHIRPPLPAIAEQQLQYEEQQQQQQQNRQQYADLRHATDRPFSRDNGRNRDQEESNLLTMHGSGMMDRGLNNSATVYLNPDQEFSESKMSIYDNLNYIRI